MTHVLTPGGNFMHKTEFKSNHLKSAVYSKYSCFLDIVFQNDTKYRYYDIPESLYKGLVKADSHGSFFDEHIKKGNFKFIKLINQ